MGKKYLLNIGATFLQQLSAIGFFNCFCLVPNLVSKLKGCYIGIFWMDGFFLMPFVHIKKDFFCPVVSCFNTNAKWITTLESQNFCFFSYHLAYAAVIICSCFYYSFFLSENNERFRMKHNRNILLTILFKVICFFSHVYQKIYMDIEHYGKILRILLKSY